MQRRLRVWSACLLALAAVAFPVGAALAAPPAPTSLVGFLPMDDDAVGFAVSYAVQRDGSMDVTQRIRWDFPEGQERHGIYRTIQTRAGYQDSTTQYRHYELSDVEVTSPTGAPTGTDISLDEVELICDLIATMVEHGAEISARAAAMGIGVAGPGRR